MIDGLEMRVKAAGGKRLLGMRRGHRFWQRFALLSSLLRKLALGRDEKVGVGFWQRFALLSSLLRKLALG